MKMSEVPKKLSHLLKKTDIFRKVCQKGGNDENIQCVYHFYHCDFKPKKNHRNRREMIASSREEYQSNEREKEVLPDRASEWGYRPMV